MTIVSNDGKIITWHIRDEEDLGLLLATPEERNRLLAEPFRQMLDALRSPSVPETEPARLGPSE
jgi:hypothetical protein